MGVTGVSTWPPLEAEMLWQLGVYIRNGEHTYRFHLPLVRLQPTAYRPLPHRLPRVLGATPMGGREASH